MPLIVLAGKEYGSGSSRDWAAKGTKLLGVRAVIAESFERIHRSNLVGMGVLPLQFDDGENAESLGLTGEEEYSITGVEGGEAKEVTVRADDKEFTARVRIDTPKEVQYYQHGGILPFVLRRCSKRRAAIRHGSMRPWRIAHRVTSTRSRIPSLARMFSRWRSTVRGEMCSSAAICSVVCASAISLTTSRSRAVSGDSSSSRCARISVRTVGGERNGSPRIAARQASTSSLSATVLST